MTKSLQILYFGAILIACCTAEAPIRQRFGRVQQQRRHYAARQQLLATEAVTPYPAAGLKPEIPFNLPSEVEVEPRNTYLPPDSTYGPPPAAAAPVDPVDTDAIAADADAEAGATPDDEQQPAVVGADDIAPVASTDADNSVEDENNEIIPAFGQRSERFVVSRRVARNGKLQRRRVTNGRLVRL